MIYQSGRSWVIEEVTDRHTKAQTHKPSNEHTCQIVNFGKKQNTKRAQKSSLLKLGLHSNIGYTGKQYGNDKCGIRKKFHHSFRYTIYHLNVHGIEIEIEVIFHNAVSSITDKITWRKFLVRRSSFSICFNFQAFSVGVSLWLCTHWRKTSNL